MLREVDHVLKLVREDAGRPGFDVRAGVRAAQGGAGVGDDRVEDLATVRLERRRGQVQVWGEEESRDVGSPRSGAFRLRGDRKSTRLNSSHGYISYAVFCLK